MAADAENPLNTGNVDLLGTSKRHNVINVRLLEMEAVPQT